jgi:geranylgeranyl diphosphate synthase type I
VVDAPAVPTLLDPRHPLGELLRAAVDDRVTDFLGRQAGRLENLGPEVQPLLALTSRLLAGGKRLRPAFCIWGYVAAAGRDDQDLDPVLTAAASLELLHASALVHDDVMDGSDTRRGAPAVHRQFEALHTVDGRLGDPESFGRAAAILLGDLLLMWSVEMLERAGLPDPTLPGALAIAHTMRTEVTCGQYLDVAAQSRPLGFDLEHALDAANRVVEYKSARYTVYRPAQLGATIGGGSSELLTALAGYGSPLGRAFQLRDDLLGVFGDPAVTGKPVGDDLREGKRTVLVAHTMAHTDAHGRALLVRCLGDPDLDADGVAALQQVIVGSGAREAVESMIAAYGDEAVAALAAPSISAPGREALTALAAAAVNRDT